jgi:HPt (histidine-containing phosphotransfer) domain-containing protein
MSSTVTVADLASGHGPIDLGHLARMTCGDKALEREVLALFLRQSTSLATSLAATLADASGETARLVHTLKGSARAIGAFRLADHAAAVEDAVRRGIDPAAELAGLRAALAEATHAIEALLSRP